ncbi:MULTISPECIES: Qat anti-phage system QueC-like protein QatC [unclassified Deinococcus]|uniref:Qat anti-phage system QueC-like protein QatC n=1 Tax=unclassified Deinococcus TaxID=2623546 RepID=UPI001C304751|nr:MULTISPECIES: Qat anti-phage system QueC-like protein QatC [unclassified Deinococcus]MDK2013990.1 hypothetical protein [Deinococcus sp. 43]
MTWNIITHVGSTSAAAPLSDFNPRKTIEIRVDTPGTPAPEFRSNTMYNDLRHFTPTFTAPMLELMTAATAAYTADVRVPRTAAYDSWTRELHLHLGVSSASRWSQARETLQKLLAFLTGDHWTVSVTEIGELPQPQMPTPRRLTRVTPEKVALFSGGLDSFVGALDLLAEGTSTVLCGHYGRGGPTGIAQHTAINALRSHTGQNVPYIRYSIGARGGGNRASEITTRGRSMIFLATGALTAEALGARTLVVPENGFISLNVPLTPARVGSFSTKTTHPHLMNLFQTLLQQLGINVVLEAPYRFKTKGEVLRDSLDPAGVQVALEATMSCAHPGASRFVTNEAHQHCGYCFPCLIRRAAVPHSDPTKYWLSPNASLSGTKAGDVRAVQVALARRVHRDVSMFDVLKPGPLPPEHRAAFVALYNRGLDELSAMLGSVP